MIQRLHLGLLLAVGLLVAACDHERQAMVATANRHASEAAAEILEAGGSAADAAIAAQLVLGLVEPQSSGIGGGAFALHWDEANRRLSAWDGRETAPAAAGPDLFMAPDGKPMDFHAAATGGRPVGVPGAVSMLWELHRTAGKLDWSDLFTPALRLAEDGFPVSRRLHGAIADAKGLAEDPMARQLYFQQGQPVPVGHVVRNQPYARSLWLISTRGPIAFYDGEIAEAMVTAVAGGSNPGLMTRADLRRFRAVERPAVCRSYRAHRVCGMPPPSSGGLTTLMMLGLLEPYRMDALRPNSPTALHLISQAARLAFADRNAYMADPDFVEVPSSGLMDASYLTVRGLGIDPGRDMGEAAPGTPPAVGKVPVAVPALEAGTSHLAIVDAEGNAVSMTTSVERSFGARIMAAGFVLNNQLTDFSFEPERDGQAVANRVEGGKRPRSSMSPTIVFDPEGELYAAVGSPGGARIIGYVAHTLVALIDWKLPMQSAIDLPRIVNLNGDTQIEAGTRLEAVVPTLEAMGHKVAVQPLESGLHGIRIGEDGGLDGGADRRREGVVIAVE